MANVDLETVTTTVVTLTLSEREAEVIYAAMQEAWGAHVAPELNSIRDGFQRAGFDYGDSRLFAPGESHNWEIIKRPK